MRVYLLETRYEFLKLLRTPAFVGPTLAFPVLFYVLFGLLFGGPRAFAGTTAATYMLATYGAFGVVGAALFGFGLTVATERAQGWLLLKRASPMPPAAYPVGKVVMAMAFSALIVLLLSVMAAVGGGAHLSPAAWARLVLTLVLGAVPFCALGLAIGFSVRPSAAPAVVNLVYLPMAFIGGLGVPIEMMPRMMQSIARALPTYHLGQLALCAVGGDRGGAPWAHVLMLMGTSLVCIGLAWVAWQRTEQ